MVTNILLLCGASTSGKTYIRDQLCKSGSDEIRDACNKHVHYFHAPLQVTTRPIRDNESIDSYYFMSVDDYKKIEDNLTCKTHFNGNHYGTLMSNLVKGNNVTNIILASEEGVRNTLMQFKGNSSYNIETALVLSDFNEEELKKHNRTLEGAKNELYGLIANFSYDYYIPNYIKKRASLDEVLKILKYI